MNKEVNVMKVYDLTGPLAVGMWDYGKPFLPFRMERISSFEQDEYIASRLELTTHTGTHVDCTRHFGEERPAIDQIDVASFLGKGRLIDVSELCQQGQPIPPDLLRSAGAEALGPGEICVLRTGWDRRWNTPGYAHDYPYLTVEAVQYLRDKHIKLFATDIPIIGDPNSIAADLVLCEAAIPSAYALVNLGQLPREFMFSALPLKIEGGDGSPVRAVAWTE